VVGIGTEAGPSRRLALRYLGATVGIADEMIVFDQQQLHRNVGIYSDLYVLDRNTGEVRAITAGQRLQDPDVSPDGTAIVAVRQVAGRGEIVTVRLSTSRMEDWPAGTVASEVDTQFSAPRWSPDGKQIAVERHRLGALSEIVVIDMATHAVRVVAGDPNARIVTPAWRPDGHAIVAAADFNADTFNLYEFPVDAATPPRQLTHTTGGALWPDVSRRGDLIAFAGYTVDGFDVFTLPYPVEDRSTEDGPADTFALRATVATNAGHDVPTSPAPAGHYDSQDAERYLPRNYSPWSTLSPTSWTPLVTTGDQLRAGFGVNGVDVLGRHSYSASATWLVSAPVDALKPSESVPDWEFGYTYDRWLPALFVGASSQTLFDAGPADSTGRPTPATDRTREIEAGVLLPFRHVLSVRRAFLSVVRTDDRFTWPTQTVTIARTASRVGLAASTARLYGYSISPEDGYSVGATAELARDGLGSSADETTFTVDGRAYLPGLGAHHVVALRGAAGTSSGTPGARRTFLLGGALSEGDVLDFGRDAASLLRGFPSQSFAGTHVALVNADYRWPIARPQRGAGTWPLFLHTIHAAVFADAGETWTDRFSAANAKTSAGGELSLNLVAGYAFSFTATVGAAWGHDATDNSNRNTAYVRVGRAF
jgi:hypothetical protein